MGSDERKNNGIRLILVSNATVPDWIIADGGEAVEFSRQSINGAPCTVVEIIGARAKFNNNAHNQTLFLALPGRDMVAVDLNRGLLMITDLVGTVLEWSRWFCPKCSANSGRIRCIDLKGGQDACRVIECGRCSEKWTEPLYQYHPRRPPPESPPPPLA